MLSAWLSIFFPRLIFSTQTLPMFSHVMSNIVLYWQILNILINVFIWLHWILVAACGIFQLQHANFQLQHVGSSSLTSNGTQAPLAASQPLDHQGSPYTGTFLKALLHIILKMKSISMCSYRYRDKISIQIREKASSF